MDNKDIKNTSFYYSVNMLRLILGMGLITESEYESIVQISAAHYSVETIYI